MNIFKFPQEPLVDVSHLPDLIDTVALMEGRCDGKYALVSGVDQLSIDIPYKVVLIKIKKRPFNFAGPTNTAFTYLCKTEELIINGSYRLLDGLFESSANAHDLTNTLHAAAEEPADAIELFEVPPRYLDNDIVQARFKASGGHFRHRVLDSVQRNAKAKLSGNEGKGITRRLRGQRRRT